MQLFLEILISVCCHTKKFNLKLLIYFLILLSCNSLSWNKHKNENQFLSFEYFDFLSRLDSFKVKNKDTNQLNYVRMDYYLVSGVTNVKTIGPKIDSFVCNLLDTMKFETYHQFFISFYKKTDITNKENLFKYKDDFYRHSEYNDRLIVYEWQQKSIHLKHVYPEGNINEVETINNFDCGKSRLDKY
ncbi:MAG: hypothetical protein IPO86_05495 [Saprospiraceae bacterium]|nr:hypothetical protein [Saprospiraceae bacterium]